MKVATLLFTLGIFTTSARTWTSTAGKPLEATFISATETEVTLKRDKDGKVFTVPLNRLIEADRTFIKEEAEAPEPEVGKLEGEYAHLVTGDWVRAEHGELPYAFYGGKELVGSSKVPLVISLHGKSDNNENGKQIGFAKKFAEAGNYEDRPCLILAPLCYQPHGGTGGGWDDAPGEETLSLVKDLLKKLPIIDEKRVYVIGYSMGGFGTWHFLKEEPKMFAAGVPIAGGSNGVGKLRAMPIWSFHGAKDDVVGPASARNCADELKRSKVFKYTEYPDAGHGIAGTVTDDPELHKWLFEQAKK
ncbi:prolyl oligopeptidase family serine peptidase [bacterium]|nr:prolyl oligopeptidase family serine peptidase [Akkermansiaceae bacterium]MDB4485696.1 prolyl oligopeptidase family serine peptidase [bacterium]MDB0068376.1 prolyl oligopeptidase family serine peptidase [Akkermansiaceae bacterium]MDB4284356.1 prolyl oligopeptidase family serine peptidase [Akkermansiaceae bacterium]MDB4294181.1 prolyl oligopeptidase family serine peptidase [Akkermansiaceae bacterium]